MRKRGPTAHGSINEYGNRKCRCEPCRAAWAKYQQDRKSNPKKRVPATAAGLWACVSEFDVACQDCFAVELRFDPAHGPALFARSCTLNRDIGPCDSIDDLLDALASAGVTYRREVDHG